METNNVKMQVIPSGPLMVEGSLTLINRDGNTEQKEGKLFLCRCGHSANKPYCDGAHRANEFDK
jgi:CDGSH-type Zn-finger protein